MAATIQQTYQATVGTDHPPHARTDVEWAAPSRPTG